VDFELGIKRFVFGLGKKAMIADFLAIIADNIFALENAGAVTAWIGAIAYMLEIYFDFSGYSDMAIGLGRCFGFHFKENFNYPYLANSVKDFWKRWHMSLTDWFRDYVYIPLGGNRVSTARHIANIIIVWILTGIWHGANWTFLLWGSLYCIFQLLETYVYDTGRWFVPIQKIYALFIICICWVIFKSDNVLSAARYIANMFGRCGFVDAESITYLKNSCVTILLGVVCALPIGRTLRKRIKTVAGEICVEVFTYILLVIILIMTAVLSISGGYSPFIYFNF
jgi:D-alanyl-lipoteichoic acid acyltransferase DltB (MBOAT superfamily)